MFQHVRVVTYGNYIGSAFFDSNLNKYFMPFFSNSTKFTDDVTAYPTAEKIEITEVNSSILIASYNAITEEVEVNVSYGTLNDEECSYLTGYNKDDLVALALSEFANKPS
jgi:hypothetical protein